MSNSLSKPLSLDTLLDDLILSMNAVSMFLSWGWWIEIGARGPHVNVYLAPPYSTYRIEIEEVIGSFRKFSTIPFRR